MCFEQNKKISKNSHRFNNFTEGKPDLIHDRNKITRSFKQHPEAVLLLFENYSHSSSMLSFNSNSTYSKKLAKEQVCLYSWVYPINHNENKDENET